MSGEASFVQVKKAHKALEKVTQKLSKHRSVEKHFVEALIALASSEFADSSAVQRVVDKLNEVKNNMTAAMAAD
jgi:hypothetical protein